MKQGFQATSVGLFFVCGLALIYVVFAVIGDGRLRSESGYQLEAVFSDLKTLTSGTDVRMAGVRIGSVEATGLRDGEALAQLRISGETRIPADSVATIAMASLLGQNYVSISFGGAETYLAEGDRIETHETADLNAIIAQVGQLGEKLNSLADSFGSFGGEEMQSLFANLDGLVTENRSKVDSILTNLEDLTASLNDQEGTLGKLINDPSAYNDVVAAVEEFKQAALDAQTPWPMPVRYFARSRTEKARWGSCSTTMPSPRRSTPRWRTSASSPTASTPAKAPSANSSTTTKSIANCAP
ncbi:MAG: MlaD family protein [Verrucomicrobiota bacterium]